MITGVSLIRRVTGTEVTFAEHTKVWMKALNAGEIAAYYEKVNPLDKAGAYGAQEFGATIIERIEGSFANVMGLPVERLQGALVLPVNEIRHRASIVSRQHETVHLAAHHHTGSVGSKAQEVIE